jgi:hypothetical protein
VNLLAEPPPVLLPELPEPAAALAAGTPPADVARRWPYWPAAWAALAGAELAGGDPVVGYAFARTGYHRGLDQLRRAGWRGHGPVPWRHEPNQGVLRAVAALARAAAAIGEHDEAERCRTLLADCDPDAVAALTS